MFTLEVVSIFFSVAIFASFFVFYEKSRYPKKIQKIKNLIEKKEFNEALDVLSVLGIKLEYLTSIYLYYMEIYFQQENWHSALYYVYLIEKTEICQQQLEDKESFFLKKIKILENIGRYEEALVTYQHIDSSHFDEKINYSYGLLLYKSGKHYLEEALQKFKNCYEKNYRSDESLKWIIKIYFQSSFYKKGIEYFTKRQQNIIDTTFLYGNFCYYFYGDYYQVDQNLKEISHDLRHSLSSKKNKLRFRCLKALNNYEILDNKINIEEQFVEIIKDLEEIKIEEVINLEVRYCYLEILLSKKEELLEMFRQVQYINKKNPNYRNIAEIFHKFNQIINTPLLKEIYMYSNIEDSLKKIEELLMKGGVKNFSSMILENNIILITINNGKFYFVVHLGNYKNNQKAMKELKKNINGLKIYLFSFWGIGKKAINYIENASMTVRNISKDELLSIEKGINIFTESL